MRLFALRGASSVDRNDAQAILGSTEWLLREILKRNDLHPSDVVKLYEEWARTRDIPGVRALPSERTVAERSPAREAR